MSSSVHVDNKNINMLVFDKGPTQGLDDTTLTQEAKHPNKFTQSRKNLYLICNVMEAIFSYVLMQ